MFIKLYGKSITKNTDTHQTSKEDTVTIRSYCENPRTHEMETIVDKVPNDKLDDYSAETSCHDYQKRQFHREHIDNTNTLGFNPNLNEYIDHVHYNDPNKSDYTSTSSKYYTDLDTRDEDGVGCVIPAGKIYFSPDDNDTRKANDVCNGYREENNIILPKDDEDIVSKAASVISESFNLAAKNETLAPQNPEQTYANAAITPNPFKLG